MKTLLKFYRLLEKKITGNFKVIRIEKSLVTVVSKKNIKVKKRIEDFNLYSHNIRVHLELEDKQITAFEVFYVGAVKLL
jgi:hypothetical protein